MPMRKLISPMMPSARTPTTSKRWMTAFTRKRFGPADHVGEGDQRRAEEAEQADQGPPVSATHSPSSLRHADGAAGLFGRHARRHVEIPDLLQQADLVAAGADHLGAAVADRAVDDPRADRVHPVDVGQVDGQRVGKRIDLALRGRGARDRQRAGDPVNRAVRVDPPRARRDRPCAATDARLRLAWASRQDNRPLSCRCGRLYARRHGERRRPCCSCPSGTMPRGRSAWARASGRAGSRRMPGFECADAPQPGARYCSQACATPGTRHG